MSGITVQLVFAFVGTRVPYYIPGTITTPNSSAHSRFGNASYASVNGAAPSSIRSESAGTSPHQNPRAAPRLFTAQELLSHLAKPLELSQEAIDLPEGATTNTTSSSTARSSFHKPPVLELFDYATLEPLENTAVLCDEQLLLVLCDIVTSTQLVEALQHEWLEVYSGAHHPHSHTRTSSTLPSVRKTDMAVCTTEERLRNVAQAQQALCKPVGLHLSLLGKELTSLQASLATQKEQLTHIRSAITSGAATAAASGESGRDHAPSSTASDHGTMFPLLTELEPSLVLDPAVGAVDAAHLHKIGAPLGFCEARIRAVDALTQRAVKHNTKLTMLATSERATEEGFEKSDVSRACAEYLDHPDQDLSAAEAIIADFQVEMTRQLKVVRQLVAYITQVRSLVNKAKHEMGVVELILSRLSLTSLRPQLMETAEALLRRRVILRRAARRQMLLLQETEFVELKQDLECFSQRPEVQKVLPEKVRWYLRTPLPSLQPEEDPVATLLDHALIDREEDEAQELLDKTCVYTADSSDPAQNALQITEAMLPVERLVFRLQEARASVASYKLRVEELEERLKILEAAASPSPQPQENTAEVESSPRQIVSEGTPLEDSTGHVSQSEESVELPEHRTPSPSPPSGPLS